MIQVETCRSPPQIPSIGQSKSTRAHIRRQSTPWGMGLVRGKGILQRRTGDAGRSVQSPFPRLGPLAFWGRRRLPVTWTAGGASTLAEKGSGGQRGQHEAVSEDTVPTLYIVPAIRPSHMNPEALPAPRLCFMTRSIGLRPAHLVAGLAKGLEMHRRVCKAKQVPMIRENRACACAN